MLYSKNYVIFLCGSWLSFKYDEYISKILYCYILTDFLTGLFVTTMVTLLWNTNHLRDNYHTSYEAVCAGYDFIRQQLNASDIYEDILSGSSNCLDYCSEFHKNLCDSTDLSSNCSLCSRCVGIVLSQNSGSIKCMEIACWLIFSFHEFVECRLFIVHLKRGNASKIISPLRQMRIFFMLIIFLPLSKCDFYLGMRPVTQWQIGVFAVLVSWCCLISTINKIPYFNILMPFNTEFYQIYMKLILMIGLILSTFAVCFKLLLPQSRAFQDFNTSFIKTLVWLLGDLGYDDTFLPENGQLDYTLQANFLFLIFILGIGSLILNFIIRDSSDAIDSYREKSVFYQASSQLSFYLLVDDCFPSFRRDFSVFERTIPADHSNSVVSKKSKQNKSNCNCSADNAEDICNSPECSNNDDPKLSQSNRVTNELLRTLLKNQEDLSSKVKELSDRFEPTVDASKTRRVIYPQLRNEAEHNHPTD